MTRLRQPRRGAACILLALAALLCASPSVQAEEASYGLIELLGLSRDTDWPLNASGPTNAMVCNVNGPDRFLSVRSGPGADYPVERSFNRLTILEVDTGQRRGAWIRVLGAHRTHTTDGQPQEYRDLAVTGWAHDGYLCSFIDYPAPGTFEPAPVAAPTGSKSARCEWDNGLGGAVDIYDCAFLAFDGNGSFSVVRDNGYELMLVIEAPGVGSLTEFLDGRRGGELGRFTRSGTDAACWQGSRGERLCAR